MQGLLVVCSMIGPIATASQFLESACNQMPHGRHSSFLCEFSWTHLLPFKNVPTFIPFMRLGLCRAIPPRIAQFLLFVNFAVVVCILRETSKNAMGAGVLKPVSKRRRRSGSAVIVVLCLIMLPMLVLGAASFATEGIAEVEFGGIAIADLVAVSTFAMLLASLFSLHKLHGTLHSQLTKVNKRISANQSIYALQSLAATSSKPQRLATPEPSSSNPQIQPSFGQPTPLGSSPSRLSQSHNPRSMTFDAASGTSTFLRQSNSSRLRSHRGVHETGLNLTQMKREADTIDEGIFAGLMRLGREDGKQLGELTAKRRQLSLSDDDSNDSEHEGEHIGVFDSGRPAQKAAAHFKGTQTIGSWNGSAAGEVKLESPRFFAPTETTGLEELFAEKVRLREHVEVRKGGVLDWFKMFSG
ncbi:hypothetical protein BJ741DRAFT_671171 [Chytriomyces cf. hyalinus JEL632]|nr:hypothetical protein BJ741DRAFT_671171 [Chytriomyces cf. hyalinus JEL632]